MTLCGDIAQARAHKQQKKWAFLEANQRLVPVTIRGVNASQSGSPNWARDPEESPEMKRFKLTLRSIYSTLRQLFQCSGVFGG